MRNMFRSFLTENNTASNKLFTEIVVTHIVPYLAECDRISKRAFMVAQPATSSLELKSHLQPRDRVTLFSNYLDYETINLILRWMNGGAQ